MVLKRQIHRLASARCSSMVAELVDDDVGADTQTPFLEDKRVAHRAESATVSGITKDRC